MFYTNWKYRATSDCEVAVMPDGCKDILLIKDTHSEPNIELTDWDDQVRTVELKKGQRISGFRLCPGLTINSKDLLGTETDENSICNLIEDLASTKSESIALVQEISDYGASILSVARQAGVSTRTLQRQFNRLGLPKPEFWRLLCRARLAASALPCRVPLVEIAVAYGYSDQSHMTRDFTRWFGVTPAQLRQDSLLLDEVCQLGLGNWTGEHISIR